MGHSSQRDRDSNIAVPPPADTIGTIFVELQEENKREKSGAEILEEIRRRTGSISGIVVEVKSNEGDLSPGKPIQIHFASTDRDRLQPVVEKVRDYMLNHVEGLRDIDDSLPVAGVEWVLSVDKALAGLYGVDVATLGLTLQMLTNGAKLGEYRPNDADDSLDIRIRYPIEHRGIAELDELQIATASGLVPLSNFVTRKPTLHLDTIQRIDQLDVHMIRADTLPNVLPDTKLGEIEAWLDTQDLDPEVDIQFRGANEEQEESAAFLSKAFSFALLLMFVLLVTQFNSIYQSFLTMFVIVLSTAGVFLGLVIAGQPFSIILTGVGVVALAGMVVNSNIVLIDTFNLGRKEQPDRDIESLIVLTGLQRLRPVLITTITTIIGLPPLASHQSIDFLNRTWSVSSQLSGFWVPLTQAIVFGLTFATVLTLLVTPAMLILPTRLRFLLQDSTDRLSGLLGLHRRG